ncbi:MAG TPA: M23 family metallopeptidase [Bacillota bacterium]|jgi:murein DD-endopeptidase MepM/ murein hydrolase activator NlpD
MKTWRVRTGKLILAIAGLLILTLVPSPKPAYASIVGVQNLLKPVAAAVDGGYLYGSYSTVKPDRGHHGLDLNAASGSTVMAAAGGEVATSGWDPAGYGNWLELRHTDAYGSAYYTFYAHLSSYIKSIPGQGVTAGEPVAYSGSTGDSTGPHLHFEVRQTMDVFDIRNPLEHLALTAASGQSSLPGYLKGNTGGVVSYLRSQSPSDQPEISGVTVVQSPDMHSWPGHAHTYGYMDSIKSKPFPDENEIYYPHNYYIPRVSCAGLSYVEYNVMYSYTSYISQTQRVGFYNGQRYTQANIVLNHQ